MADDERDPRLVEIGDRVREQRSRLKLTQQVLADRAELSKSHLSEIEGGLTGAGGLVYLRLADALEKPVQWLLTGEEIAPAGPDLHQLLPEVSVVADELGWSHRQAIDVSAAINAVQARRTAGGSRREAYTREAIVRIARVLDEADEGD